MIIKIAYRRDSGEYSIGKYSYYCDIPDIAVGDVVIAPTSKGDRAAKVVEIDVPESKVDERYLGKLETIEEREVVLDEDNRT